MQHYDEMIDQEMARFDSLQMKFLASIDHKPAHIRWREARMALNMARREFRGLSVHGDLADQADLDFVSALFAAHPDATLIAQLIVWVSHVECEKHSTPEDLMNTFDLAFFEHYQPTEQTIWDWASKEALVNPFPLGDEAVMENAHKLYVRNLFVRAVNHTLGKAGLPMIEG